MDTAATVAAEMAAAEANARDLRAVDIAKGIRRARLAERRLRTELAESEDPLLTEAVHEELARLARDND